jgi:hypothetical protein
MGGHQGLHLRDDVAVASTGELGGDQYLVGDEPELLQPCGVCHGCVDVGEVRPRVAPPERQRRP